MPRLLLRNTPPLDTAFTLNRDSQQARGLVAWWPSLGASGPSSVRDRLLGSSTTVTGSPTFGANPVTGLHLDCGSNTGRLTVANGPASQLVGPPASFTASIWYRNTDATADNKYAFASLNGSLTAGVDCRLDRTTGDLNFVAFDTGGNARFCQFLAATPDSEWHLVAVGFDGATAFLQVDARRVTADWSAFTFQTPTAGVVIGGSPNFNPGWYGLLADFRIYNRALSAQDVWQLWAPQTRWELYQPIKWRTLVQAPTAAAPARMLMGVGM